MTPILKSTSLTATAAIALAPSAAAQSEALDEFLGKVRSKDDRIRGSAWQGAAQYGAVALGPLSSVMTDSDFEVARSAKRAMWQIVRSAGRPGADKEKKGAASELLKLLKHPSTPVRREALWMLSEIGGSDSVKPIAVLLETRETREDARAALERIPGRDSIAALQAALKRLPEEYRPALAQSLRARGVKVAGYPSQKLVPTRQVSG